MDWKDFGWGLYWKGIRGVTFGCIAMLLYRLLDWISSNCIAWDHPIKPDIVRLLMVADGAMHPDTRTLVIGIPFVLTLILYSTYVENRRNRQRH